MSERLVFRDQERMFDLLEGEDGQLFLDVVCGSVGLFEVRIRLSDEQKGRYEKEGMVYLQELAFRVAKSPDSFKSQVI